MGGQTVDYEAVDQGVRTEYHPFTYLSRQLGRVSCGDTAILQKITVGLQRACEYVYRSYPCKQYHSRTLVPRALPATPSHMAGYHGSVSTLSYKPQLKPRVLGLVSLI